MIFGFVEANGQFVESGNDCSYGNDGSYGNVVDANADKCKFINEELQKFRTFIYLKY